jgi:malonyl-CoA O-methyltransferase
VRQFESLAALAAALRAAGARNAHAARPRGLTTRRRREALAQAYESRRERGGLPATFEVVYGAAFAGEPRAARPDGEFVVSLDKLLTR